MSIVIYNEIYLHHNKICTCMNNMKSYANYDVLKES